MFNSNRPSFHYITKPVLCALAICIMLFGVLLTDSQAASGTINGSVVNVRSAPSTSAKITGTLLKDAQVELVALAGDWYQIKFANLQGFVARELISTISSSAPPSVILNGTKMQFEVDPTIENGRTLVPIRAIFEAMGASVEWNETTRTVTARNIDTTVILPLGSTSPTINGQTSKLEVPAKIVNDRTLAPLRFVSEAFGGKVDWNEQSRTITIAYTASPTPTAVIVKEAQVNLRAASSVSATILDTAENGETMAVLSEKDGWYQVKKGSITAWIASWVVEAAPAAEQPTPAPTETETPVITVPAPPVPTEPENALSLSKTRDASGIKVIISSKLKLAPTISQDSGSIQYKFTDCPLAGVNSLEEAMGSDKLTVKASSSDGNTLVTVTLPADVTYKMSVAEDGKNLVLFIPNYLISIAKSAYGSVGDRYLVRTLCPVTYSAALSGDQLAVALSQLKLRKNSSYNFSSDLVSSMNAATSPDNSPDVLLTFNTINMGKYNFAVTGSNLELNIVLMRKIDTQRAKIVVLDAGHGGSDTGARGSQINEKVVNLAVVQKAGALLQQKGIQVEYTRIDDSYVGLLERSNIANELNAGLFVSVHCNAVASAGPGGTETYFYAPLASPDLFVQRDERYRLASLLQTQLVNNLQRSNRGVKEGNLSVLRESLMPCSLIEMAFISNPNEQALLMNDDFQNLAVAAIANAVEQYMNSSN